jgi:hypothetical protein
VIGTALQAVIAVQNIADDSGSDLAIERRDCRGDDDRAELPVPGAG